MSNATTRGGLLQRAMEQVSSAPIDLGRKRGRSSGTASFPFYVTWFSFAKKAGNYHSFGGYPLLRFAQLKPNDKQYQLSEDGTQITFNLTGGKTFIMSRDTYFFISVPDSVKIDTCENGTWWWAENVGVSQWISKSGAININVSAGNFEPWADAPDAAQMFDCLSQAYNPLLCNIRPISVGILPQINITEEQNAIKMNQDLTEDQRKEATKLLKKDLNTRFDKMLCDKIVELRNSRPVGDDLYFVELLDRYNKETNPNTAPSRKLYFCVSKKSRDEAEELDKKGGYDVLTMIHRVQFADTMFVKDSNGKYVDTALSSKEEKDKPRPDKRMIAVKGEARIIRIYKGEVQSITAELCVWNFPFMDALGIYQYDVAENLLVQRLNELEMVVAGKPKAYKTWDMPDNQNVDQAYYPGLYVEIDEVHVDYKHFFTKVCCRVNSETAIDLFKQWIYRKFKFTVQSRETLRTDIITTDKTVPRQVKESWKYYLERGSNTPFDRMSTIDKRVMNMMGKSDNLLELRDIDEYMFFVFAAGNVREEFLDLFEEHSAPQNDEHLAKVSSEMLKFCTTGNSEYFKILGPSSSSSSDDENNMPKSQNSGPEYQVYAVRRDYFNSVISQPYVVLDPPVREQLNVEKRQVPIACSSTDHIARSASELLDDDDGKSIFDMIVPATTPPIESATDDHDDVTTPCPPTSSSSSKPPKKKPTTRRS